MKDIYEARQDKTRLRKGQGYTAAVESGQTRDGTGDRPPPAGVRRRTSSEVAFSSSELTVDFDKFKRVLQLEAAPPEPI